jgi:hypothetical protein
MKSAAQSFAYPIAISRLIMLATIGGAAAAMTLAAAPGWAWLALKVFLAL